MGEGTRLFPQELHGRGYVFTACIIYVFVLNREGLTGKIFFRFLDIDSDIFSFFVATISFATIFFCAGLFEFLRHERRCT